MSAIVVALDCARQNQRELQSTALRFMGFRFPSNLTVFDRRGPRQSREGYPETSMRIFGNDPAAGSPTATLLRLLLPLAEKYCLDSAHLSV